MYVRIHLLTLFIVAGQLGFPVASQSLVATEPVKLCLGNHKLLCCRVESSSPSRKFKIKRDERSVKKVVCYGGESRLFFLMSLMCFDELRLYTEGDQSAAKPCSTGLLGYCCPPDTDPVSYFPDHLQVREMIFHSMINESTLTKRCY